MNNAATLGISAAFEAAIVEHCAREVRVGRTMNQELMVEAMHAVIRRHYSLLDKPAVVQAVCNTVHAALTIDGTPARKGELSAQAAEILSPAERARFAAR